MYEIIHLELPFKNFSDIVEKDEIEFENTNIAQKLKPIIQK